MNCYTVLLSSIYKGGPPVVKCLLKAYGLFRDKTGIALADATTATQPG